MWSAATDAYAKNDLEWIRTSLNKIMRLLLLVAFVIILMIVGSNFVYCLWIGSSVNIPIEMSVLMGLYVFIIQYSLGYSYFLNGMGKLRLQVINILFVGVLFCPLCYFLSQFFGVNGILIGMILVNLSGAILNTIQMHKLLRGKAMGIWAK